jgi:uncharacterized protein YkwD
LLQTVLAVLACAKHGLKRQFLIVTIQNPKSKIQNPKSKNLTMSPSSDRSNLSQAKRINSNATLNDRVNGSRPVDLFQFDLRDRSQLKLNLRSSGSTAQLKLIRDRNNNGRLDAGEVVKSARLRSSATDRSMNISALDAGTYFIQVTTQNPSTTKYRLQLMPTKLDTVADNPSSPGSNDFRLRVLQLTNEYRQSQKLAPLTLNDQLAIAAQRHSEDMLNLDFFEHDSLDGKTPEQRTTLANYRGRYTGENIAAGYQTPETVVEGWINSPGHRENLLNPDSREMGLGYVFSANDPGRQTWRHYWTQVFGTSR